MANCRTFSKQVRSRFVPDASATVRVGERDELIALELYMSGILSRENFLDLDFFTSVSRANRVLRRLFDTGIVRRFFPRLGAMGTPALYGLGKQAVSILAKRLGVDPAEVALLANRQPARMFVDHTLAVNDLRVRLHKAAREQGWKLRFSPERLARHEYSVLEKGRWRQRVLRPDAFFRLDTAFGSVSFLLEADLGHVSRAQWRKTIAHYEEHARLGLLTEAFGTDSCPVLTVTSGGPLRRRHLMEAAPKGDQRFLFATVADLDKEGILGPVWWWRGCEQPQPLLKATHYDRGDER